jgi:hypothetical protein
MVHIQSSSDSLFSRFTGDEDVQAISVFGTFGTVPSFLLRTLLLGACISGNIRSWGAFLFLCLVKCIVNKRLFFIQTIGILIFIFVVVFFFNFMFLFLRLRTA